MKAYFQHTRYRWAIFALLMLLFVWATYLVFTAKSAGINKVSYIEPQYSENFNDDRVLDGAAHNIFVAKVVNVLGTKDLGVGPETQYTVQVLENIKGDLRGNVTIDQIGGYKDGTLYILGDKLGSNQEENYLLKPGNTYLLATRFNKDQNWHTVNTFPTAHKLLSNDANISNPAAVVLIDSDQRVQQLKAAYPNEILLAADVKDNNALNSYVSIHGGKPNIEGVESSESKLIPQRVAPSRPPSLQPSTVPSYSHASNPPPELYPTGTSSPYSTAGR